MRKEQNNPVQMNTDPLMRLKQAEDMAVANTRALRKKSALLFTGSMVLIVVLVVAAIAWYTRVANTDAVTFQVANYDFAVNGNKDGEFKLNMYNYSNVTNQKMAPGTIGYIPLEMSAEKSDVDVNYQVSILSKMPKEIQKRMCFFYLSRDEKPVFGGPATFSMNANMLPNNFKVNVYNPVDGTTSETAVTKKSIKNISGDNLDVISGTLPKGKKATLYIYWMWYWDADAAIADSISVNDSEKASWDALDTDIGRYPEKYKDAFVINLYASGVEAKPEQSEGTE